jgi:hypothetical protein
MAFRVRRFPGPTAVTVLLRAPRGALFRGFTPKQRLEVKPRARSAEAVDIRFEVTRCLRRAVTVRTHPCSPIKSVYYSTG